MVFLVQDDDGTVSGANAYADLTFVREYHADRGLDLSAPGTSDDALKAAIIKATDYLDKRWVFPGERRNRDQDTEHPRRDLYDRSGYLVTGIHRAVKQAVAELAQRALTQSLLSDPTRDDSGRTVLSKREEVGPFKDAVEYAGGGGYTFPEYPAVDRLLISAGLVRTGLTGVRA